MDLQFLIDNTGHIYHLDLDRLFELDWHPTAWPNKFYQAAPNSLKHLKRLVLQEKDDDNIRLKMMAIIQRLPSTIDGGNGIKILASVRNISNNRLSSPP